MKLKGIYLLYRFLQALGLPIVLLYFAVRGYRAPGYARSLWQRLGFLPASFRQTSPGAIWLHAVSVGEILSSVELIRQLRKRLPRCPVFVSTATIAGRGAADEKLAGLVDGVFFAPLDYVFATRRVLRTIQPSVVVVMETEIWPNLYREVKRIEAGLLIVNGRISDRALPRYLRFRWFFAPILSQPDAILAQSEEIRDRYLRIGAPTENIQVGGNLKYDFQPREAAAGSPVRALLDRIQPWRVWIAASTMPPAEPGDPDEDDAVITAFQTLSDRFPKLLLILAPRRPERFDTVAEKLRAAGIPFVRRTAIGEVALPGVLLLDTIGELSGLFALADVVFMGGTLASRGGHNILEPAFFARPVIIGPHMENFAAIAAEFRAEGACREIGRAEELAGAVADVLLNPGQIGRKALACARARRGVTERAAADIARLHASRLPRYRSAWYWLFLPFAEIWEFGSIRKQRQALIVQRRLGARVISVGNLSMGGTGKTPVVLYIAEHLRTLGRRPGILTRGYGRHSPDRYLTLEPGARVPVEHTGDEPQLFLRSGLAPVGIGGDRYRAGRMLEERFGVDTVVLDDGFQHLKLDRDLDLVLVDGLNPFRGREVFPLGGLREPMEALARASAFVITRSDASCLIPAIEETLRRYNRHAPVFHSRVAPDRWISYRDGTSYPARELPFRRTGAFCGLGNPESFWATLRSLGIQAVDRLAFGDHHVYKPRELRHLAEHFRLLGADALLTTEKDMLNLCEDCNELVDPLPILWLRIHAEIEEEAAFLRYI